MSRRMTAEDEAKFALLEPDGFSPLKTRQRAAMQNTISQRKGVVVLAFSLIFILYLAYPRPGNASASWSAASGSSQTAVESTTSSSSARSTSASSDDLGDTVVVNKEQVVTSTDASDTILTAGAALVATKDDDGSAPAVIRHVAGGDENIEESSSPPPPPPAASRGIYRFFAWLRGRKNKKSDGKVAELIDALRKDISSGKSFEQAEMGQRLAQIEALEREETDGAQKTKDLAATRSLEDQVEKAAHTRHDLVSEQIAKVESLMATHGAKHPDLIPKLKALENDLAHPDLEHPNQDQRVQTVQRMRAKIEALNKAQTKKVEKEAAYLEKEVSADEEEKEVREAEEKIKRRKELLRRRKRAAAKSASEDEDDGEEEVIVVRRPKKARVVVTKPAKEAKDEDEED